MDDSFANYLNSKIEYWDSTYKRAMQEPPKRLQSFRAAAKLGSLRNTRDVYLSLQRGSNNEKTVIKITQRISCK